MQQMIDVQREIQSQQLNTVRNDFEITHAAKEVNQTNED